MSIRCVRTGVDQPLFPMNSISFFRSLQIGLLSYLVSFTASATLPIPTRPTSFPLQRSLLEGAIVGWGAVPGQVPTGLNNVVQVAAGSNHVVALKSDGTVVAWGANYYGQTNVPAGLTGVVQVAAGESHVVALKSDGTVVGWGSNTYGETSIPSGLTAMPFGN